MEEEDERVVVCLVVVEVGYKRTHNHAKRFHVCSIVNEFIESNSYIPYRNPSS